MTLLSRALLASLSIATLLACGPVSHNSDAAPADSATDASGSDGASSSATVIATFKVQLTQPSMTAPGSTAVLGRVQDAPTPSTVQWTQSMQSGDCKLLLPSVPSCAPSCGSSAACVSTNTCQRYPNGLSAGAVTLSGLSMSAGSSPVALTNVANNYQLPAGTMLTYPAFAEGATLTLQAAGEGSVPAFTASNMGIAPLTVTSTNLTVAANSAVNLTWTAPMSPSAALRIKVKLDISHHGGTRGQITCDTDDDGSLEIAAPLVTALVSLGVAGFPSIVVTRERTTSTTVAGAQINFSILSDVEQYVTIPGVRSCTDNADCMGMGTCREDLTCG